MKQSTRLCTFRDAVRCHEIANRSSQAVPFESPSSLSFESFESSFESFGKLAAGVGVSFVHTSLDISSFV